MSDRAALIEALQPILREIASLDAADPAAAAQLNARFPLDGETLAPVLALVAQGVAGGWLTPKGEPGMRFGRVSRPAPETLDHAVDAVDMDRPGPAHTHPRGEFNLCVALDGAPSFDGQPPGWVVLPPGSWHVPTVTGGRMAILYFLPGGAWVSGPEHPPQV